MSTGNQETRPPKTDTAPKSFRDILESKRPLDLFNSSKKSDTNVDRDERVLKRFQGSLVGLAVGDALGASVEFRPHAYMQEHPVKEMSGGGTWGLEKGKWTDDTSMALCLSASLVVKRGFDIRDQFQRYKMWFKDGYLSSVDRCFDIGKATREAIVKFIDHDAKTQNAQASKDELFFGDRDAAGNGSLMRAAPIPLFFYSSSIQTVMEHADTATRMTHGDERAVQASQYFAYLIHKAAHGTTKEELLEGKKFCGEYKHKLNAEVEEVVMGSYKEKKNGYEDGIRGQGFVVKALEAALWAFYYDENSFEKGVLKAINLGDDTDTTAAIYGQLAGAYYGIDKIPEEWRRQLYKCDFIERMATELYDLGSRSTSNKQESNWD